ncbi:MAG TPA: YbaK/EbsC family protein [Acidimicrobiia bacterium]|nr:YbaK/EbsC family protein [Acidimicrobiia bacterium]
MSADLSVIAALDANSIRYEEMACDPDLADTAQFCAAYDVPMDRSANTILVASRKPEGHVAACLVLATTRLDVNGMVRRRLGVRKASFASAEQTKELTGMEIGGVTVFGLPSGIPVWIDGQVLAPEWVIIGAGSRSAKIKLDPRQFVGLEGVEIVDDLALPVSA